MIRLFSFYEEILEARTAQAKDLNEKNSNKDYIRSAAFPILYDFILKSYKAAEGTKSLKTFDQRTNTTNSILWFRPHISNWAVNFEYVQERLNLQNCEGKYRKEETNTTVVMLSEDVRLPDWEEHLNHKNKDYRNNADWFRITLIAHIYSIAKSFVRYLVLARSNEDLKNNEELGEMAINLASEFDNYVDIADNLYPIYNTFYLSTFVEKLSIIDFRILLEIFTSQTYSSSNLSQILKPIKNDLALLLKNYHSTDLAVYKSFYPIYQDFEFFLRNVTSKILGVRRVDNILTIASDFIPVANSAYHVFVMKIGPQLSCSFLLASFTYPISPLAAQLLYEFHLENERTRFLTGDFSVEKQRTQDEIAFATIFTGEDFERYLKQLFEKLGFFVEETKFTGDQGADLLLQKNGVKIVVQAKFYSSAVGNKAVQEVTAAVAHYNASTGMVVTNNRFTRSAIELAKSNGIKLIDGEGLKKLRTQASTLS